jgi:Asp-tRNA(Asn)/Glu-tRNA(Gln) amidotransferase A subunit family amidase
VDGIKAKYATANMGYTTPFMTGNPIVSMPVGYTTEKLPTGVQVICNHFQEYKLMNIVRIFKQIINTI